MDYKVTKIKLSDELALQKIKSWCAYQERSQQETRQKLYSYGLSAEITEGILAELIGENFLNEERFALAFAGGKFRIKHWGRNKIKAELKKHRVSEYCLKKALASIDAEDYERIMIKVMEKKLREQKGEDSHRRLFSVVNYLIARGFESDLVQENLSKLHNENLY